MQPRRNNDRDTGFSPACIQTQISWKTLQVASRQGSNASRLSETPRTRGPPRQSFRCIYKNNTRSGASCGLPAMALFDVVLVTQHFQVFQSRLPKRPVDRNAELIKPQSFKG